MQRTKKEPSNCTVICLDVRNKLSQTLLVRAVFFFAAMVAFLGFFAFTAALEVETENADKLVEEFSQMVMDLDGDGIFAHNAFLALLMFIPGFGVVWGITSASVTGYAFASLLHLNPDLPISGNIFHHVWHARADCIFYCNFAQCPVGKNIGKKKSNCKTQRMWCYTAVEVCIMMRSLSVFG